MAWPVRRRGKRVFTEPVAVHGLDFAVGVDKKSMSATLRRADGFCHRRLDEKAGIAHRGGRYSAYALHCRYADPPHGVYNDITWMLPRSLVPVNFTASRRMCCAIVWKTYIFLLAAGQCRSEFSAFYINRSWDLFGERRAAEGNVDNFRWDLYRAYILQCCMASMQGLIHDR